jgi:uncharacterized RDD family membrane protein YckC
VSAQTHNSPRLRLVRREELSFYPKASLLLRAGARAVDLAIALMLYRVTGPAGVVVALLYLLSADGMLQGQSLGKKLFGVKVVYLPSRAPARYRDSFLRNSPFGLVVILGMMPEVGAEAFFAAALVLGGVEAWKVVKDAFGLRLGDAWAQTQVVDGKVPSHDGLLRATDSDGAGRALLEENGPSRSSRSALAPKISGEME